MLRLDELNPPQREAVEATSGPVLVLAGAGSGKTRVITYRVAHLLERGARPDEVLAVSFTNKAADEMQHRVAKLVGRGGRGLTLSTFHSLGLSILKAEREALGLASGFTIYDASDQLGTVREILRRVSVDDRRFDVKAILFRISRAKNAFVSPEEYAAEAGDHEYDLIAADVYPKYQAALRSFHALDFDDLITETVRLLDRDAEVRARWQARWRWVMVDEYQDTNRAQFLLMSHLVAVHKNLCVVGDDDQSIYGWRGAEAGHILEFERHFPGARVVKLEENYRSTPSILDAANGVIAHNPKRHPKRLWTARRAGEKLKLVVAEDAEGEARFVAEEIELLCGTRGYKPGDCAVLYRSNIQAKPLEEALRTQRLNYKVIGGTSFFDRKEVKDAIAYLKLALSPRDEISLRRVINYPARGIGSTTIERLAQFAATHKISLFDACTRARTQSLFDAVPVAAGAPVDDLAGKSRAAVTGFVDLIDRGRALLGSRTGLKAAAREFLEAAGLPDDLRGAAGSPMQAQRRLENLEGFLDSLERFEQREGRDLNQFLHRLMLQSNDADAEVNPADTVTLVTLHGAKGLEFPVVFLVGLEEELIPHRRTLYPNDPDTDDPAAADLGEERRLMYVGITRAREILYMSWARTRSSRASARPRSPSRFLDEIPPELYDKREAAAPPPATPEQVDAVAHASLAAMMAKFGED
ncbi:MAG TPA: UvrD-helicase domain-containing protein [Polyangia bacterium]|nr:UvrD-helicase domain-containing protein [Polyangia bacterium]